MRRPSDLDIAVRNLHTGATADDLWGALQAAHSGDKTCLHSLLKEFPDIHRASCHGTTLLQIAVREGHVEVVELLLDAGANPMDWSSRGESVDLIAAERGFDEIESLLHRAGSKEIAEPPSSAEHGQIHTLAEHDDAETLASELQQRPELVRAIDSKGATPLHRAAAAGAKRAIEVLVAHEAPLDARHGPGRADANGYAPIGFEPIDMALWSTSFWNVRGDQQTARDLISHGASHDIVIAAALGDRARVAELLDRDPGAVDQPRPSGKRALSAAVEFEHDEIVEMLLDRGADPNAEEGPNAPSGSALHAAARLGAERLVDLLLQHGADPNGAIDSSGSPTYAAKTQDLRERLIAAGGELTPYDLVWLGEDQRALERVAAEPETAHLGCGTVFAAACKLERRELLAQLLAAGAPVPHTVDGCRSYLLEQPDMLLRLLESGMDADLPDWQGVTLLHLLCECDLRGRPRPARIEAAAILLDAGADPRALDDEYASTPLAWAARSGLVDMVDFLLERGLGAGAPDEHPWATPLSWAKRRGHEDIAARLAVAGEDG